VSSQFGAPEAVSHAGYEWCVDSGVILRRQGPADDWELWGEGDRGPRPPADLLASTAGASEFGEGDVKALGVLRGESVRDALRVTYLGGTGVSLEPGRRAVIAITSDDLCVLERGSLLLRLGLRTLRAAEVGGPGLVREGGGFFGGGFGIEGAVEGMAIAGLLNALTTRTSINTVISIAWADGEAFFHTDADVPHAMRVRLSPIFVAIDRSRSQPPRAASVADEIAKLARLHSDGALTDEEFATLKSRLIDGSP